MTSTAHKNPTMENLLKTIGDYVSPGSVRSAAWKGAGDVHYCIATGAEHSVLIIVPIEGVSAAIPIVGTSVERLNADMWMMNMLFSTVEKPLTLSDAEVQAEPLTLARAVYIIDHAIANTIVSQIEVPAAFMTKIMGARNAGYMRLAEVFGPLTACDIINPPTVTLQ